ncbi:MAG: hypothetical protein AB7V56_14740 [Candidatus Nitrosocosmicus sp.]
MFNHNGNKYKTKRYSSTIKDYDHNIIPKKRKDSDLLDSDKSNRSIGGL